MPTYSYACTDCGTSFDIVQKFTDDSLTVCESCGGRLRKLFNSVGIVFKGSGFYRTDSRAGSVSADAKGSSESNGSSGSDTSKSGESSAPSTSGESSGSSKSAGAATGGSSTPAAAGASTS